MAVNAVPVTMARLVALGLLFQIGCGIDYPQLPLDTGSTGGETPPPGASGSGETGGSAGSDGSTGRGSAEASSGSDGSGGLAGSGLPCDVADVLDRLCLGCHGGTPVGAPMSLATYEDLVMSSFTDPQLSFAQRAVIRMADTDSTMPPAPASPASAQDQQVISSWIDAGMPMGDCSDMPTPDPFDVDPVCSTDSWWDPVDDDGTPLMFPGRACLSCHEIEAPDDEDVPNLAIGGTVFETAHEPDDCKGPPGELDGETISVEVTSADGQTISLPVNTSGNFLMHAPPGGFPAPYLVKVVHGDLERAMPIPAPSGDCNACHTQDGAEGAPGRIVLP